jgi:tRNA-splicing endonuclease subunit Sen34
MELLPEEADILINEKIAYMADDPAVHFEVLRSCDRAMRQGYIESIKRDRLAAQKAINDETAARRKAGLEKRHTQEKKKAASKHDSEADVDGDVELFSEPAAGSVPRIESSPQLVMITPTTSRDLVPSHLNAVTPVPPASRSPLYAHLHSAGYYMMPGLRFGALWNVYPGDPLRYHAHFLAHEFGWDEEIEMLDLVARGRLGTAVKKSFLIGGEVPKSGEARAFCIEWAGM